MDIVFMARQILDMHAELCDLRWEVERLRDVEKEYGKFVGESVRSGQDEMANWMKFLLAKEITVTARESTETTP